MAKAPKSTKKSTGAKSTKENVRKTPQTGRRKRGKKTNPILHMHPIFAIAVAVLVVVLIYATGLVRDWYGVARGPGEIMGTQRAQILMQEREQYFEAAVEEMQPRLNKQILFGDLHVHTTNSTDAFVWSLPIYGGEGIHQLADACDYARHCSAIDFWAITDHAEAATPRLWEDTKQSIRACNALSTDPKNPDLTSFIGFEWTQVGATPEEHFGHKNVIFRDLEDEKLSKRPIASGGVAVNALRTNGKNLVPLALSILDFPNRQDYFDIRKYLQLSAQTPLCQPDTPIAQLPNSCFEIAETPADLMASLDAQGVNPLVIPHGSTWGFYTPTGVTYDKHLKAENVPDRFRLMEIMSGHGNSEEYRTWRSVIVNEDGTGSCPAPQANYLPTCWQAGEIIRERCLATGQQPAICEDRAAQARNHAANASVAAHLTVPGTKIEEWLDAGQCRDCFLPSFGYRPANSVQYALAIRNFDEAGAPKRMNWGFIASSDNHRARPGTGYKPVDRLRNTEAVQVRADWVERLYPKGEVSAISMPLDRDAIAARGFGATEMERQASFWTSGGLAAVHANGRGRDEIFDALERRETYATSGARILLWFNTRRGAPMGSTVQTAQSPLFEVKAVGALKQKPGCPDSTIDALGATRTQKLCAGECFNPSGERHKITHIDIIRVRPQISPDEDVAGLIDDPWATYQCKDNGTGCAFKFRDPSFADGHRMATYYVRAVQEPTKKMNGDNLRCTYDDEGNCISVNLCYGDERTAADDTCAATIKERAWSSPIYVEHVLGQTNQK